LITEGNESFYQQLIITKSYIMTLEDLILFYKLLCFLVFFRKREKKKEEKRNSKDSTKFSSLLRKPPFEAATNRAEGAVKVLVTF
jgi:hypothetical protein